MKTYHLCHSHESAVRAWLAPFANLASGPIVHGRVCIVLARMRVASFAELARYSEEDVRGWLGVGPAAIVYLKTVMAKFGLHFGMTEAQVRAAVARLPEGRYSEAVL